MSRRYALGVLLVTLFTLSAITSCLLAIGWYLTAGDVQSLQARADAMNRTSTLMQQLATESVEYGRQNPAINTVLNQLNIRPSPAQPAYQTPPSTNPLPAARKQP